MTVETKAPLRRLRDVSEALHSDFRRKQRLLSFSEYFSLVSDDPVRHTRNVAQYVRDAIDYFGSYDVNRPGGRVRRFRLFDCPFDGGSDALAGQEEVQNQVYEMLERFVHQGKVDRLLLLHGPNGSAKSTFVDVLDRALKHYSTLDEGALYRFNWVFPTGRLGSKGIGFAKELAEDTNREGSYARLPDDLVEARLTDELRDHPLLLIPAGRRRKLLADLIRDAGETDRVVLSDYMLYGDLSHRNRLVFEALLAAYDGDVSQVLQHVQVERFFLSRRYRVGLVTVEPKLAVDAATRQVTLDRSLSNLPAVLQSLGLFLYSGELVAANRGVIEFADLLKRPVEAFKYLINTVENGRVTLEGAMLYLDTLFFASTNEVQLAGFRENQDFSSFRGRFEFVTVPYVLDYHVEREIYAQRITERTVGKPVGPHALDVAALWAVLTRLFPPDPEYYPKAVQEVVASLNPLDKARFYADGILPEGLSGERLRQMHAVGGHMVSEYRQWPNYEGNSGVSPRTMLALLSAAAQNPDRAFLSPVSVMGEIAELCKQRNLYDFLRRPAQANGYWDAFAALSMVEEYLLDTLEEEMWEAVGLVDHQGVDDLLDRYVQHMSAWARNEKVRNQVTGESQDPDDELMAEFESRLGVSDAERFRNDAMTRIAAWALSHPEDDRPKLKEIFARELKSLWETLYAERQGVLSQRLSNVVHLVDGVLDEGSDEGQKAAAVLASLEERYGHTRESAREAVGLVLLHLRKKASSLQASSGDTDASQAKTSGAGEVAEEEL